MCLIVFAWKIYPQYKLLLAANRDEYRSRLTSAASFQGDMLAGKDLQAGGTWLGVSRQSRIAAVTNFRCAETEAQSAKSRGVLVTDFLAANCSAADYLKQISLQRETFRPFNLLLFDGEEFLCYNSKTNHVAEIKAGIYALSNHSLDSDWPKQNRIKQSLQNLLANKNNLNAEDMFEIMLDRNTTSDSDLPETGIGLEWERRLSPIFIDGEDYATRSTTVLTLDYENRCQFVETTHSLQGESDISCNESFGLE